MILLCRVFIEIPKDIKIQITYQIPHLAMGRVRAVLSKEAHSLQGALENICIYIDPPPIWAVKFLRGEI